MDGMGVSVLVPLELLSSPGAGGCSSLRRLGASKPGPAATAGVCSEAFEARPVEGSACGGQGPKVETTQETEAKDLP